MFWVSYGAAAFAIPNDRTTFVMCQETIFVTSKTSWSVIENCIQVDKNHILKEKVISAYQKTSREIPIFYMTSFFSLHHGKIHCCHRFIGGLCVSNDSHTITWLRQSAWRHFRTHWLESARPGPKVQPAEVLEDSTRKYISQTDD